MPEYKLALIGYGNVGRALTRLLVRKSEALQREQGITSQVVGIATRSHGIALNTDGIDVLAAAEQFEAGRTLENFHIGPPVEDTFAFIQMCRADVLFEISYLNAETGQPALDYIRMALNHNMHVVTANKGPVVHGYHELRDLAQAQDKNFFFEATVMDGAPIFSTFRAGLPSSRVHSFRGVLNSTTNLILTEMEHGKSFEEAVRYAQEIGIAETDPMADVDGWDAAVKAAALATVLMDYPTTPDQVEREGIRALTLAEVQSAQQAGAPIKLLCTGERTERGVRVVVKPTRIPSHDPLAQLQGASSAVAFKMDTLKELTILEHDPGPEQTAYGLLADFINAVKH